MSAGPINYGDIGAAVSAFQHARMTDAAFDDVLARLREGIGAAKLWVLHEIDPQAVLQRGGHTIGRTRQILFFHPDLMIRLLAADRSALLEAPLKFAVMELPDGTVSIRWQDPAVAFGRYQNRHLDVLGSELAATCERIVEQATDPGSAVPAAGQSAIRSCDQRRHTMSRSILFAVAIMSAFAMGSANAADPAPASESDQLHAACSKLGYSPGEAQFDQCLTILKDTMAQMHHSRMGKMINDACGAAGFTAGTPQYASCVQRLTATLEADERNNG